MIGQPAFARLCYYCLDRQFSHFVPMFAAPYFAEFFGERRLASILFRLANRIFGRQLATRRLPEFVSNSRSLRIDCLEDRTVPAVGRFRIAEYNIAASTGTPQTGLDTILQGIGNEVLAGNSQPIDVLALQEVELQSTTSQAVVNLLNAIYGAGTYSRGTLDGASTGSGTQGVVYRNSTMQLLSEATIGTASATGQPRQALRYKFHPVGYSTTADFYLYNSHYKADSDSVSQSRRAVEATAIRNDANALGQGTQIIYAGDFNAYSSTETFYQTLLSAGTGQAFDPINTPGSWHNSGTFTSIFTQAPAVSPPNGLTGGGLDDRFDFQLNTAELTDNAGLDYVSGTYHTFGNNGSVPINGNINAASSTALSGLANRTTILNLLTTVTDHLPVVADYRIVDSTPPGIVGVFIDGSTWTSAFRTAAGNATYGYPAQTAAAQLTPLPWSTINTVSVKFSENVAVVSGNLGVRGINVATYSIANFSYDSVNFVAKWTLTTAVDTDRLILDLDGSSANAVKDLAGNKLAGTWTEGVSTFPTAGSAGVNFQYRTVIAVGDADRNAQVRNADVNVIRANLFVDAGSAGYSIFADIDGDGLTRNADVNLARGHLFVDPPAGPGPNRPIGRSVGSNRGGPFVGGSRFQSNATSQASPPAPSSRRIGQIVHSHGEMLDTFFQD